MKINLTVTVFPRAMHPEGYETDGEPETITFDEDKLVEILRVYSKIPLGRQRDWNITAVEFK